LPPEHIRFAPTADLNFSASFIASIKRKPISEILDCAHDTPASFFPGLINNFTPRIFRGQSYVSRFLLTSFVAPI
jgi:hypothetical protein